MIKNITLHKRINSLPKGVGVYIFKDRTGRILYVGKAVNLKNRVKSHSIKSAAWYRSGWQKNIVDIDWIKTANAKEALILENQLIKKYQPRFNIQWKDDKSYFWVEITDDKWPRVKIVHQKQATSEQVGPFVNGRELRQTLRVLRKILPFRTCKNPHDKPCLQAHLDLCPAHKSVNGKQLTLNSYRISLQALAQFLRLYAGESIRIEAYDISNIHGAYATGSMIVFLGNKPKKSDYRRFKIKTVRSSNDAVMIKEILRRRLKHAEWPYPDLILIDGGKTQLNAATKSLSASGYSLIPVIALAKRENEIYTRYSGRPLKISVLPMPLRLTFQAIRNEAHRFAIFYYRYLHAKQFRRTPKKIRKKD